LLTEVVLSEPGVLDVISPVSVAVPYAVMRYGAVVVVGLELVPLQATYKGLTVVLPGAGMNVTTLVVLAAIVPLPDAVIGAMGLDWADAVVIVMAAHPISSNAIGIVAIR
jgi:hypothetical protein